MAGSPEVPQLQHTIARPMPAYEPPTERVRRRWILIVAALVLTGATSLSFKPVCERDRVGVDETRSGIRHELRGKSWYHCEPWIQRVLTKSN